MLNLFFLKENKKTLNNPSNINRHTNDSKHYPSPLRE